MIHARSDYDRIQDPAVDNPALATGGRPIAVDEPVFLVRASDLAFRATVQSWIDKHRALGGNPEMVETLKRHLQLAHEWQEENDTKVADAPEFVLK